MVYVTPNFKSKKALKDALAAGQTVTAATADSVKVPDASNGTFAAAGPHWPESARWYATLVVEGGKVVKVK